MVISADASERPLWGATVLLNDLENNSTQLALTDTAGHFAFTDLVSRRVRLIATKSGYVPGAYGATSRGEPGLTLVLAPGQVMDDLTIRLVRGAAMTGRLVDETGAGVAGISISALERRTMAGESRYVRTNGAITDDRGGYRIFGLPAGTYVIAASLAAFQTGIGMCP